MMQHILQHDWCSSRSHSDPFVDEVDIDNCVIEKILRNKFWDPLISSDDDDEEPVGTIDWDTIFKKKNTQDHHYRVFVPGHRIPPPHPKISALTKEEHRQCVKVISGKNQDVLPKVFLGRPYSGDIIVFENKKELYAKEQKEYIEWAKHLWVTTNCIRALRPKHTIEMVYEAEFKMKAHMMQSFPKNYTLAAQIPLRADNQECEIIMPKRDLIPVNISELPEVLYPEIYEGKVSVLHACAVPEPCAQHPCQFKLPNETAVSLLPLTEIHKELAQYANENGASYIASENAIKCLLEMDRSWTVPVSVCDVIAADGERTNVVVFGNDFPMKKDPAPTRSYKAFRHLLQKCFTKKPGKARTITERSDSSRSSTHSMTLRSRNRNSTDTPPNSRNSTRSSTEQITKDTYKKPPARRNSRLASKDSHRAAKVYTNMMSKVGSNLEQSDDSDEDNRLLIDLEVDNPEIEKEPEIFQFSGGDDKGKATKSTREERFSSSDHGASPPRKIMKAQPRKSLCEDNQKEIGLFNCVCKDSEFEVPAPRSFRNWQIRNYTTKEEVNIIIHCSHKHKSKGSNEVILEPILEYQLDIGGTLQSQQKLQSLAFSLMLRKNADLINVRLDAVGGEVVTIDTIKLKELTSQHGDCRPQTANTVYTVLNQLAGLLPGDYILQHEPIHGCNAMLFCSSTSRGAGALALHWRAAAPADEAKLVQKPPNLGPVLLPYHKNRRQLPLTFTYDPRYVAKETSKTAIKKKPPPAAIQLEGGIDSGSKNKWPKKKKKKRGRKKNKN